MYKKTLLSLLFILSCSLSSCRVTRQEVQKIETNSNRTSERVVTYQDTTVYAPKAETSIVIPIDSTVFKPCLNPNSKPLEYTQKNGQAQIRVSVSKGIITATATCDSLAIAAKIRKEFQHESTTATARSDTENKRTMGFDTLDLTTAFIMGFGLCYVLKTFKIV